MSVGSLGRVAMGIATNPNAGYWATVGQIREHIPPAHAVLGSASVVTSLPHRGYDFYRLVFPYRGGAPQSLANVVQNYGVDVLVMDGEWRQYQTVDMMRFVERSCSPPPSAAINVCSLGKATDTQQR
jgi:hypothetical protein